MRGQEKAKNVEYDFNINVLTSINYCYGHCVHLIKIIFSRTFFCFFPLCDSGEIQIEMETRSSQEEISSSKI